MRVFLAVGLCVGLSLSANLLQNPGFEDWTSPSSPDGWSVEDPGVATVSREQDTVCFGSSAARLVRVGLEPGTGKGLAQRVAVQAGEDHLCRVRCLDDVTDASACVLVSWLRQDSTFIRTDRPSLSFTSDGWQRLSDTLRAPAGAALAEFALRVHAPGVLPSSRRVLLDEAWFGVLGTEPAVVTTFFVGDSLWERLVEFLDGAQVSLDYCCYNSSRAEVVQAVLRAHDRGVRVRLVTDNTRLDDDWVRDLRNAGVEVWTDSIGPGSSSLMHNKFCVRDLADADTTNDLVWTASYNPNAGELRADCALRVPHTGIASAYLAEFEQMWGGSGDLPDPGRARFHTGKTDVLPTHDFKLEGNPAEVYFAPQDRVVERITETALEARETLWYSVFAYTWDDLGDAMVDLWQSGVWVAGVIDKSGANGQGSEYPKLLAAGLPVYIDSVMFGEKTIHEKLMVVDSLVTVAGSANWSRNANTSNDENTIVLRDPNVARRVAAEIGERYLETGGTGIEEPPGPILRQRAKRLVSPGHLLEGSDAAHAFDCNGRMVESQGLLAPGVYFLVLEDGGRVPVVVVR